MTIVESVHYLDSNITQIFYTLNSHFKSQHYFVAFSAKISKKLSALYNFDILRFLFPLHYRCLHFSPTNLVISRRDIEM